MEKKKEIKKVKEVYEEIPFEEKPLAGKEVMEVPVIFSGKVTKFGNDFSFIANFENFTATSRKLVNDEVNYIKGLNKNRFKGTIIEGLTDDRIWVRVDVHLTDAVTRRFFLQGISMQAYLEKYKK